MDEKDNYDDVGSLLTDLNYIVNDLGTLLHQLDMMNKSPEDRVIHEDYLKDLHSLVTKYL